MKEKYKIGLVIGRFQPFHLGHVFLIKEALRLCEKVVIGIGSSNVLDQDNIFTFEQRLKMIELFIREEKLEERIIKVVPIPDVPDDEEWFEITKKAIGHVDVVLGNNDWVNRIFEENGYKIKKIEYFDRVNLEGKKIRELIQKKENWGNRVASYIQEMINSSNI